MVWQEAHAWPVWRAKLGKASAGRENIELTANSKNAVSATPTRLRRGFFAARAPVAASDIDPPRPPPHNVNRRARGVGKSRRLAIDQSARLYNKTRETLARQFSPYLIQSLRHAFARTSIASDANSQRLRAERRRSCWHDREVTLSGFSSLDAAAAACR